MHKVGSTPARVDGFWWLYAILFVSVHVLAAWGAFYWRPYYKVPTPSLVMGCLVFNLSGLGCVQRVFLPSPMINGPRAAALRLVYLWSKLLYSDSACCRLDTTVSIRIEHFKPRSPFAWCWLRWVQQHSKDPSRYIYSQEVPIAYLFGVVVVRALPSEQRLQ